MTFLVSVFCVLLFPYYNETLEPLYITIGICTFMYIYLINTSRPHYILLFGHVHLHNSSCGYASFKEESTFKNWEIGSFFMYRSKWYTII